MPKKYVHKVQVGHKEHRKVESKGIEIIILGQLTKKKPHCQREASRQTISGNQIGQLIKVKE